jgi:hypothetical protein
VWVPPTVWAGTTGVRQPVLPTQTAGTTDLLRELRNQSIMSFDFRSGSYPTLLDVVEDDVEVPLTRFFSKT